MKDRLKRILAFVIDWNIALLPTILAAPFIMNISQQHPAAGLLLFPLILAALAVFVLRDVIFRGRSLGKRIMGLYIYDRKTLDRAGTRQRAIRNLFFFLYFFDGIILLASGQTIGDRAAGTVVLSQKDPTAWHPAPASSGKTTKTIVIAVIAAVIIWIAAIVGIVLLALNSQKNSEEYQLAYQYLISSSAFEELNADESSIFMNQYASRTALSPDGGSPVKTVQIGFLVNSRSFEVVCHQEDGVWQVCGDCTLFD